MLIDEILTLKEAEERWQLSAGLLRQRIRGYSKIFNPGEIRKSGGTWLITSDAMERLYGKEPNEGKQ